MNKNTVEALKGFINKCHAAMLADDKAEFLHIIEDDIVPLLKRKRGRQPGWKKNLNKTLDISCDVGYSTNTEKKENSPSEV